MIGHLYIYYAIISHYQRRFCQCYISTVPRKFSNFISRVTFLLFIYIIENSYYTIFTFLYYCTLFSNCPHPVTNFHYQLLLVFMRLYSHDNVYSLYLFIKRTYLTTKRFSNTCYIILFILPSPIKFTSTL